MMLSFLHFRSLLKDSVCKVRQSRMCSTLKRVAVCQMQATSNVEDNLNQVKTLVQNSKEQGAEFVFLPECCDFVGEHRKQTLELSQSLTGPTVQRYREIATEQSVWLSLGGLHEKIPGQEKIFNCHVIINDSGEVVAKYRKLHLFDVDTPEFKFRESEVVNRGQGIVPPIDTPIGKLGLQICYDMRFPETGILLRKMGAEILTYPSAFAYTTGKAHWETLLRSRAIENQCYVIAAAQIGFHNKKRRSFGHAMIVDPWGKIVAEVEDDNPLTIAVADIDTSYLEQVRQNMPCFKHRCDSAYLLSPLTVLPLKKAQDVESLNFGGHSISRETVFLESEICFAFTNIRCVVPGHVLVAPKREAKRLSDLTVDESVDLFHTAMKVQGMLERVHCATATTVTVQDGEDAGQTVKHVHCHVMPRKKDDFKENDMIYTALNKHDRDQSAERRSLEEMAKEAQVYRDALLSD